jgi:hypothetical protein
LLVSRSLCIVLSRHEINVVKFSFSSNIIGAQETELKGEESEACEKNALGVSLQIVKEDEKEHLHLPFKPSSKISRFPLLTKL